MAERSRSQIVKELQVKAKKWPPRTWAEIAAFPRPPRTAEVIGIKCANVDCFATEGITYSKPLCYRSWRAFDAHDLEECSQCHWFASDPDIVEDDDFTCFECRRGQDVPVYAHGPVERYTRYLYILKLNDGSFYVGQTNALQIRIREHSDGVGANATRGKDPKLAWFEKWVGNREQLNEEEDILTQLAIRNPRAIRRLVDDWQRLLKLVNFEQ